MIVTLKNYRYDVLLLTIPTGEPSDSQGPNDNEPNRKIIKNIIDFIPSQFSQKFGVQKVGLLYTILKPKLLTENNLQVKVSTVANYGRTMDGRTGHFMFPDLLDHTTTPDVSGLNIRNLVPRF